jgi:hypothetical protein
VAVPQSPPARAALGVAPTSWRPGIVARPAHRPAAVRAAPWQPAGQPGRTGYGLDGCQLGPAAIGADRAPALPAGTGGQRAEQGAVTHPLAGPAGAGRTPSVSTRPG